jgi:phage terminase large subunit-like protein
MGDATESAVSGPSGLQTHDPRVKMSTGAGGTHVTFANGAKAKIFGAHTKNDIERLRSGGNRCLVWLEEAAAMRYLAEVITHSKMGLRIGPRPHYVITTTPKPRAEIVKLWNGPKTIITKGRTLDAYHLPPETREELVNEYGGTTLGRQELEGEILTDMAGALLTRAQVDDSRVPEAPEMNLIVVGMDPANTGRGDLTGIVAAGRGAADGHAYVIADVSAKTTGRDAALRAWALFDELNADVMVVEKAGAQEWLMQVMRDAFYETHSTDDILPLKGVNVGQGKTLRAMPAAMRFQQKRAHIVGTMDGLEDEMCTWVQSESPDSPDRLDAMVHALAYIRGKEKSRASLQLPHQLGALV